MEQVGVFGAGHHLVRTSTSVESSLANGGELGVITIRANSVQICFKCWERWGQLKSGKVATEGGGGRRMVAMCCSIVAFQRAPCIYNETHYCTPAPPSEARGAA